jgi:catalase-peroxidase
MTYFDMLLDHDYELVRSPAGPSSGSRSAIRETLAPAAHTPGKRVPTMMTTADMAFKIDPAYRVIMEKFRADPAYFGDAFARAWFKLCHRDMGPKARYLGPEVPAEDLIWQDPIPASTGATLSPQTSRRPEGQDRRLGPVGRRTGLHRLGLGRDLSRLGPSRRRQRRASAPVAAEGLGGNEPAKLARVLKVYEDIKAGSGNVSIADLIVLGGSVGIEQAAKAAGHAVEVPFTPGRTDASQEETDVEGFAVLEPRADGFRNYLQVRFSVPTEELLVDRAQLLGLTAPQMAVLVGGLRVLGANHGGSKDGVFTDRPGQLTNDFFVNLLDMKTGWKKVDGEGDETFVGTDRITDEDSSGRRPAPIWCSAPTPSCAPCRKSMRRPTRARNS